MIGVESRPMKDASTIPNSYSCRTRSAMIDFNAPLFSCRRQRSYVQSDGSGSMILNPQ